jgi:formylmethanofuran dehydrogenase subunit A
VKKGLDGVVAVTYVTFAIEKAVQWALGLQHVIVTSAELETGQLGNIEGSSGERVLP